MTSRPRHVTLSVCAWAVALAACGTGSKPAGSEGGHCYPNSTCDGTLSCFSNRCVRFGGVDAATTGGAGTGGAAGLAGAFGTAGVAGASGLAGSSSSAGAGGTAGLTGTAGASGMGGTTGAAGSTGTAGVTGAAGSSGTSGSTGTAGSTGGGGVGGAGETAGTTGAAGGCGSLAGPIAGCGSSPAAAPSCSGLTSNCGPNADENCCATRCVPGGRFTLGRNPGDPDDLACRTFMCWPEETPGIPANVRGYWLDRFQVTVGRFRKFVAAMDGGWRPTAGAGKHGYLNCGAEPGWDPSWSIPTTASAWDTSLHCDSTHMTWTSAPGSSETKPITCVDWYDAYAFCIWDGGFLPTEAELELADSGGLERVFPWSDPPGSTAIDSSHACYAANCLPDGPHVVGATPAGDGLWGQADLEGNVAQWVLDSWDGTNYSGQCVDCVKFTTLTAHAARGGTWDFGPEGLRAATRHHSPSDAKTVKWGLRCARSAKL